MVRLSKLQSSIKKDKNIVKTWKYTNKNRETYLVGKTKDGTIVTFAFLGYKTNTGKIIKR